MLLPSQVSSQPRRFGSRLALIYISDGVREPHCYCAAPRPRQSRTVGGEHRAGLRHGLPPARRALADRSVTPGATGLRRSLCRCNAPIAFIGETPETVANRDRIRPCLKRGERRRQMLQGRRGVPTNFRERQ